MSAWVGIALRRELNERRSAAIRIAITANVLRRCEFHEDVLLLTEVRDVSYAYRVGNAMLTRGELGDLFNSPREMTDAVKAVTDEIALDECPRCDNMRGD